MSGGYRKFCDFMALVKEDDWEKACNGDAEAKARIGDALEGVALYYHAGPDLGEGYICVTLADLLCHGIVRCVTLHKKP